RGPRAACQNLGRRRAVGGHGVNPRERLSTTIRAGLIAREIQRPAVAADGQSVGVAVRRQVPREALDDWGSIRWRARLGEIDAEQAEACFIDIAVPPPRLAPLDLDRAALVLGLGIDARLGAGERRAVGI